MGMVRVVRFPDAAPEWPAVRDRLTGAGVAVQMRMIDNMPAFPDEEPEAGWRELRVSLGGGMLTLRREPGAMSVVVWERRRRPLADQERLLRACAEAGRGRFSSQNQLRIAWREKSGNNRGGSGSALPRTREWTFHPSNPARCARSARNAAVPPWCLRKYRVRESNQ